MTEIKKYSLIEGALKAEGLTVIIDVFRAFSCECYMYAMGAKEIRPTGSIEDTFAWRKKDPDCVLVGERGGEMCEGFDFGNSPSAIDRDRINGRRIIHTTSAGTQGVVNAVHADEILTGSFVNAKAVADYIKAGNYRKVSLVAMGNAGIREAKEDELCADYIESLLIDKEIKDIRDRLALLKNDGGEHFFDPTRQSVFPEKDFWMCIDVNRFDFVLRIDKDEEGIISLCRTVF